MNIIQKLLRVGRKPKPIPEPALYGRVGALTEGKVFISARVIRKDGTIENLGRLK